MHKTIVYLVFPALAACSAAGSLFGNGEADSAPNAARADSALDAGGLGVYLELMRDLVDGDAITRADAFADAADAADLAPTTTNRLMYALALAMPGHGGTDTESAERELSLLLADNTLLPEERVLARIHLADVEQRLVLNATADRLRGELTAARAAADAASAEQLEAALDENRRLRIALDDAIEKLEAISSIEQTIRERDNESELP